MKRSGGRIWKGPIMAEPTDSQWEAIERLFRRLQIGCSVYSGIGILQEIMGWKPLDVAENEPDKSIEGPEFDNVQHGHGA